MANRWGKKWKQWQSLFSWTLKSLQMVTAMANLDSLLESRNTSLLTRVPTVKAMVFSVVRYRCEFNHKEGWAPQNWCFQTVLLEKALESPLDCKEIKPVNCKGNQPWIFIGRTDAEARALILQPPDTELTHWKRPWCWEKLKAEGEGGGRGWDG